MRNFDLTFVGNGIISIVSALKVKDAHPHLNIAIIGPLRRTYSASIAAGAMQAVFCEVEETFYNLPREREIFDIGLEARREWHELLKTHKLQNVITADSTIMYRRKEGTLFEEANFEAACDITEKHQSLESVDNATLEKIFHGNIKPDDVVAKKFTGEFALDAADFFKHADEILKNAGVTFIDDTAKQIAPSAQGAEITLSNNEILKTGHVVAAAGTYTPTVLPSDVKMVPIYHAVGTSMTLDSAPASYNDLKMVVRTPNRGGAQCGMHIVPRNHGKFYLGAGNYLSDKEPAHRVETVRYLIDICDTELFGKQVIYAAKADLLLGSRPKSIDGYPVIGVCENHSNIFIATGTYRIGLTIAPVIAAEICRWYEGKKPSDHFKNCAPGRQLHSYAPMDIAVRYYSESRISNLIEHGLLALNDKQAIADKKVELEGIAKNFNAEIVQKHRLPANFVVDPDMYGILISTQAS